MLRFLGSIFASLIIRLGLLAAFVACCIGLWHVWTRPTFCGPSPLLETQASPHRSWLAERFIFHCGDYEGNQATLLVRRPNEEPGQPEDFVNSLLLPDSAVFKWLDDSQLLIAAEPGEEISEKPSEFRGVRLNYSTYSTEPDHPRDARAREVVRRPTKFDYRSIEHDGVIGIPGASCLLDLSIANQLNDLNVRLEVGKDHLFQRYVGEGFIRAEYEDRSYGRVQFFAHEEDTNTHVTAVDFVPLRLIAAQPGDGHFLRDFKDPKIPNGIEAPHWSISWSLTPQEARSAINTLRTGMFEIGLGYWLDNKELVLASTTPGDPRAIDDFERCMIDNKVFEDSAYVEPVSQKTPACWSLRPECSK